MVINTKLCALREVIRLLERKLELLTKQESTCCGVSLSQCHAIVEIGRANTISLNSLANILTLDNSTMSRNVNVLVKMGLVERTTNPYDRRYVNIILSKHGQDLFESIENKMNTYYESVTNLIPREKQNQVIESLEILINAIEKKSNIGGKNNE